MAPLLMLLAAAPPAQDVRSFTDAVVTQTYPATADCGYFKYWGAVDLAHDGRTHRVYFICATEPDLPKIGARCSLTTHWEKIEVITADGRRPPFEAYAVDRITCTPPIRWSLK